MRFSVHTGLLLRRDTNNLRVRFNASRTEEPDINSRPRRRVLAPSRQAIKTQEAQ